MLRQCCCLATFSPRSDRHNARHPIASPKESDLRGAPESATKRQAALLIPRRFAMSAAADLASCLTGPAPASAAPPGLTRARARSLPDADARMRGCGRRLYYTIPYHTIPYHTILYYTILYYTRTTLHERRKVAVVHGFLDGSVPVSQSVALVKMLRRS